MDLQKSRIGLLAPSPTPIWTGTANGAQSAAFAMDVTTVSGTLAAGMAGMVLVRAGEDLVRIKSVVGNTLTLAENSAPFAADDALAIYELRLPFPRYQRLDGETVYKDWDVGYPATWQHVLPPTAVVAPEAAWLRIGDMTIFDAQESRVMAPDAMSGVTAAWDATGWATTSPYGSANGVTDCYCSLTPMLAGFHYLKLTVTDEWGGATTHYVPVWVGDTYTNVLEFAMDWTLGKGWHGSGKTDAQFSYLAHSPVAVADLETREIVLFGFLSPQSVNRTFGTETFSFEILSPVEDARRLQGFPFIVTDIADPGSETPDDWAEVGELTVVRATWHLLTWHTLLPALINVDLAGPELRRIKGQQFPAGSLPGLLDEIVGSAFLVLRSARSGGVALGQHPLYAVASQWAGGFAAFDLAATERREDYDLQLATPQAMDVRLSGVYLEYTGEYFPAIARCPAHPANWGSGGTAEVTNLAPIAEIELLLWAERHFTVENLLPTLSLTAQVDVDPFIYQLLNTDVPEAPTIAIEEMRLTFSVEGRAWDAGIVGRPYGPGYAAVSVPVPAPVEIPAPTPPPITPPLPPLPPLPPPCEWPLRLYVASRSRGIYYTANFSGPDGSMPTWSRLAGSDAYPILQADISPLTETVFALCNVAGVYDLYRRALGGSWECILTDAEATALIGEGAANMQWVHVAVDGNVYVLASGNMTVHTLVSTVDGARSGGSPSFVDQGNVNGWPYEIGNLLSGPTYAMAGINKTGGGGSGRVYSGPLGTTAWVRSDSLGGSSWKPAVYYDAHNGRIYAGTNTAIMSRLLENFLNWEQPAGVAGLAGFLPAMSAYPCFYAWNTNLHVAVGTSGGAYASSLQWSDDQWATFLSSGAVGRTFDILTGVPTFPPNLILGRHAAAGGSGEYHVLYVSDDLGATQPVERAGVDPNNLSTSVSIPSDCGGIAFNGILLPPNFCEVG